VWEGGERDIDIWVCVEGGRGGREIDMWWGGYICGFEIECRDSRDASARERASERESESESESARESERDLAVRVLVAFDIVIHVVFDSVNLIDAEVVVVKEPEH
jgi:hypothetical protein